MSENDTEETGWIIMGPPEDQTRQCPTCGDTLLEVAIHEQSDHGHVMPCGCRIEPIDLIKLIQA